VEGLGLRFGPESERWDSKRGNGLFTCLGFFMQKVRSAFRTF